MLELRGVDAYYGPVKALSDVSLSVGEGELVALIGANGAGKTTVLKTIMGVLRPRKGSVLLLGQNIAGLPSYAIVRKGVALCPEGRMVFGNMTVEENLRLGGFVVSRGWVLQERLNRVLDLFPVLRDRMWQRAGTLSGGEQQMLAIARALMSEPRLLLLDEPSLGLAPLIVDQLFDLLAAIHERGYTILLVEQNAMRALELAARAYVLETGKVVLHGSASELRENEEVRKRYLGGR